MCTLIPTQFRMCSLRCHGYPLLQCKPWICPSLPLTAVPCAPSYPSLQCHVPLATPHCSAMCPWLPLTSVQALGVSLTTPHCSAMCPWLPLTAVRALDVQPQHLGRLVQQQPYILTTPSQKVCTYAWQACNCVYHHTLGSHRGQDAHARRVCNKMYHCTPEICMISPVFARTLLKAPCCMQSQAM